MTRQAFGIEPLLHSLPQVVAIFPMPRIEHLA